jgi:L-fucono-1,5-lactonase
VRAPRVTNSWRDGDETASTEPVAAVLHFDVLMTAFGEDRMIWGSNWPVSDLGGSFAGQIRLAEEYLAPMGQRVRDKVMFKNALRFYLRHVDNDDDND